MQLSTRSACTLRQLRGSRSRRSADASAESACWHRRQIVVKTSNKKYYKRIDCEELDRLRIPLEPAGLSWNHENNTLIIQYKKPAQVMAKEREAKVARLNAPEKKCRTCGHSFHASCLYRWFTTSQQSTCPLCRNLWVA